MTSFHTKYRPTTLDQVIGQDVVVKSLKKVMEDKRGRSFIFTGPSGVGKTTIARILANGYCGWKGNLHNIIEIDAATNSGADAIREVVKHTYYRAIGESPVKAIILDEAHRLSSAAWTILLKPIEEPPAHVVWFLCTTEAGKIPKTIQTRCLRYELKPVTENELLELLVRVVDSEKLEIPDEVLEAITDAAGGSPRQALVFLESCLHAKSANEARILMRSAAQSKEIIELCRFLVSPRNGRTWPSAMKIVKGLEGFEAESIRIVICNYLASCLLEAKSDGKAVFYLSMLEHFLTPYNQSEKMAPLFHSLGLAIGLADQ